MEAHVASIRRQEREAAVSVLGSKNFGRYSEEEIRIAITNARELLATYKTASPEAKALADNIVRADQYLKEHGIEAARQAARQAEELRQEKELRKVMNGRMKDLTTLSASALEETKKYWQAQRDGAEQGSRAFKVAEKNLKAVNDRQAELTAKQNKTMAGQLLRSGNLQTMSEGDIRRAIEAAKQYQQTLSPTDQMYQRLTKAIVDAEEHIKQYGIEAERAARKDAAAQQQLADKHKLMQDRMQNLRNLSQGGLEETRKYWQAQMDGAERSSKAYKEAEKNLRAIADEQKRLSTEQLQQSAKRLGTRNLSAMSEQELQASIAAAKQLAATMQPTDQAYKQLIADILRAEQHIKQFGIEAERSNQQAATLATTMNKRMSNLKSLSADALAETKKYWEAQKAGAAEGTAEFNKAEAALKKIANLETRRKRDSLDSILGDPSKHGVAEVREAVREMEQLRDSVQKGTPAWLHYNKMVEQGREYLDRLAKSEAADHIEQQMQKIDKLSASGLQEVKKYWEAMVAGAEHGSAELDQYRQKLEQVTQEERERAAITAQKQSASILSGNYTNMSESELRSAIEAAKQYQQTLKTGDTLHKDYSEAIVKAENYLHQFGLEEERVTQKRKETDRLMKKQLTEMTNQMAQHNDVSVDVLKSQHQYWQKLIDDPKNAGKNLQEYEDNLREVERLQRRMVGKQGQEAFDFFQRGDHETASMGEVKQQAEALKKWRDTLPQKTHADTIAKINEYLEQAGMSAKKAAEQTMSWKQAMQISSQAGKGGFKGSIEQLTQAKKVLEEMSAKAVKGGLAWRRMQEALQRIGVELKNVGHLSQEVQSVLDSPKGRSFNALKQAVEQGRLALNAMDRTTKEGQKQFDELAKKVKAADQEMKQLAATSKGTSTAFEKAWSRVKTYVGVYVGTAVAMQKVTATMGDLMDLSDRMGEVRKTTGFTADEVGRLSENLKKMDVRTPLQELMSISASAGQLGLKTLEDVQGFTEAANKLMIALPEMGKEAATEMMRVAIATGEVDKIRKQLQDGTIEGSSATAVAMEKIASTIDRLRATSASTAPEITDFVKRVGAVGAQSGITIDQVAALGSTVSSLGMRIEMSATALSRMIPAIRNNAFELAKAIGVTPDTIRNLFDTGRGMEVILMILQRIKDTGMDADSVEQMLGMAGMRDIMKDLNQQGARAGIVFSGLSQNVDELRRQLGVASEAYEENIAIQQEFDKMNETTAAKWERLKNAFEEAFVGDSAQRGLGWLIDRLRAIVELLTGDGGVSIALRSILIYMGLVRVNLLGIAAGGLKAVGGGLKNIGIMLGFIRGEMTKLQWANIFTALAAAVWIAVEAFSALKKTADATTRAMSDMEANLAVSTREVGNLFGKLQTLSKKQSEAAKSAESLTAEEEKLKKELEELRKKYGEGAEKTEEYKKKQEELETAHKKVATAEGEAANATNRRLAVIKDINDNYSKYLGYMLSEASTAETVASAHDLIVAALKEEMYWREKNNAFQTITKEHEEDLTSYRKSSLDELQSDNVDAMRQQQIMSAWQAELTKVQYDASKGGFTLMPGGKAYSSLDAAVDAMKDRFNSVLITNGGYYMVHTDDKQDRLNNWWGESGFGDKGFEDWTRESLKVLQETQMLQSMSGSAAQQAHENAVQRSRENTNALIAQAQLREGDKDYQGNRQLAEAIVGIQKNISKYGELAGEYQQFAADTSLKGIANVLLKDLPADTRKAVESEMERVAANGINPPAPTPTKNPWGTSERADSTTYTEMTAEQLVNRREQMNKFVNSLQTDTDVKAVLNEDKALKKAIEKGMSSDMRTVIEWYNTERLKIQDELHARHLTNTGDWLDPKKERGAKKQFRDEMDAYLHELDAYYTERKTRIEEAGTDEGLTEAEIRNRTLANEMEWQQRRAELQKLYSRKQKEVTQEELEAIYHIISERTGDSESFVKAQIAKTNQFVDAIEKSGDKGAAIVHRWMSQVELDTERSYLKGQQALTKQMKAIQDIIDKERPFNGITKQLRESLSTMDILTGDMRKEYDELMKAGKDMRDFNERQGRAELQRTAFLLGQAEQAYSTTIDRVMQQMREKGMTAWADWLSIRPEQQEALMAQLRQTYDSIQDAIKKEASQLKKQAEIMWNNILVPGGDGKTTMKQMLDRTVAQLGIDQGRVSRASSLIGAGASSERVADKLAIQQMRLQLTMQEHYYNLMKKQGRAHVDMLNQQADAAERRGDAEEATRKRLDAQHAEMALNLATAKEETELAKQREEIIARTEESQNRLYTELRSWADLLTSSLQGVFEASHAGDAEYYNERAKLNLTGKGGPGAGTYVVIDDAGTSNAKAHYEYLDERQALERQHEIEQQNAQAEAWKKVMDDINMKMSEQITDWMNAALQNQSIDANTQAVIANTQALWAQLGQNGSTSSGGDRGIVDVGNGETPPAKGSADTWVQNMITNPSQPTEKPTTTNHSSGVGDTRSAMTWWPTDENQTEQIMGFQNQLWQNHANGGMSAMQQMTDATAGMPSIVTNPYPTSQEQIDLITENYAAAADAQANAYVNARNTQADGVINASNRETDIEVSNQNKVKNNNKQTNLEISQNTSSMYARMTAALNLYGVAYQAMSNANLDATQRFQMIALQAVGNVAMVGLEVALTEAFGKTAVNQAVALSKDNANHGSILGPILWAVGSAVLGGLMGLAASKIAQSKSQIAQATGASVGAGRLTTGMLTYAEGNVNELTDPASLTPGRQYNVDGADGKTYRARYMGKGAKTHITNGPEFHLVGEAGREAIIDAKTTRLLQMNETGIWRDIQTLYNGGSISGLSTRRRRGGVRAYAEGNIGEFEDMADGGTTAVNGTDGMGMEQMLTALDRNSAIQEALLERLNQPIYAQNILYGPDGLPNVINKLNKEAQRHGEKYL